MAGLDGSFLDLLGGAVGGAVGGPVGAAIGSSIGSAISGGGSGGGGSAPGVAVEVSPQISTQISPSISPVFQQQFQPTNSAATAGTSAAPSFSNPLAPDSGGTYPYTPYATPQNVPTAYPVAAGAVPAVASSAGLSNFFSDPANMPLILIGGGLIAFLLLRH
ncbi:MAG: hypothetical protein ACYDHF_08000 [Candidatus Cryosericum sp.]